MQERVYEQMELFPLSETDQLREELAKLKKEVANLRRGLFARHNVLEALIVRLREDIDSNLCQDKVDTNLCHVKEA